MTRTGRNHTHDNLRALMVMFIVLLHAACAYAVAMWWWHAQDAKSLVFDVIILCIDNFALPVLFLIAGLFALSCLERHGTLGFIHNKLKRMGIPLLILPTFYLPVMVYVGYLRRSDNPIGFFDYWLDWMISATDWSFTIISNLKESGLNFDVFSTHHLWFISLLLVFFLLYACLRPRRTINLNIGIIGTIMFAAAGIALGFAAVNLLVWDWSWARFGPFFLFQPARVPVYLGMFLLGVLMAPRKDMARPFPGPWWAWLIGFLASQMIMLALVKTFSELARPAPLGIALLHGTLRAVLSISAAGFFLNLGAVHLGKPSPWRESLSASSYDIYLWHMPMVVFVQAGLSGLPLPLGLKAALAFLVPVLLFWTVSRTAARLGPWFPYALMGILFAGMCLTA